MRTYTDAAVDNYHGVRAIFTGFDAEALTKLPASGMCPDSPFVGEILDTLTGRTHAVRQTYAAYEECEAWDNEKQDMVPAWSLQPYFYAGHWCGCHRIGNIEATTPGANIHLEGNDVCPSGRFVVLSLRHATLPGVELMREVKDVR